MLVQRIPIIIRKGHDRSEMENPPNPWANAKIKATSIRENTAYRSMAPVCTISGEWKEDRDLPLPTKRPTVRALQGAAPRYLMELLPLQDTATVSGAPKASNSEAVLT